VATTTLRTDRSRGHDAHALLDRRRVLVRVVLDEGVERGDEDVQRLGEGADLALDDCLVAGPRAARSGERVERELDRLDGALDGGGGLGPRTSGAVEEVKRGSERRAGAGPQVLGQAGHVNELVQGDGASKALMRRRRGRRGARCGARGRPRDGRVRETQGVEAGEDALGHARERGSKACELP